ncbi:MAG: RdgB/HAM1 family non-canonical purine NTP pyrophosphatase [Candidatus Omnitrophica bacterium]|nr:RdgB/HAM1 family non-canonical purine NTP pyrophosphatase [Candidatus Omnitrophota bacterium]
MPNLLVASSNKNKLIEIREVLKSVKSIRVVSFEDIKRTIPNVVEDGKTFRENAIKKAVMVSKFFNGLVMSDDSGLEVEALGGKPGVRSSRFARVKASDKENVQKLLTLMAKVDDEFRLARFVCHIALAKEGKLLDTFDAEVPGRIAFEERGTSGFGYDPIFIPAKHDQTFAEMEAEYKNKISHRALALKKLKKAISKYL